MSDGTCVATTGIVSLANRGRVARIVITNEGELVCAAQGTVTIVVPKSDRS